ncbi:MAG TPA: hypothetical protein VHF47_09890 [Acidimicrobiales bacterium]|nr:hypothetical protein [Acidimicrobiales bacterium]
MSPIEITAVGSGATGVVVRRDAAAELLAGAVLAAAVAVWAPLPLAVLGLVLIGPAHTVLELRYVLGRFRSVLSGPFLATAVGLVTVVAAARLAGAPARRVEIVAAFALLAVALMRGRGRPVLAVPLVAAFLASMHSPVWFVLVLLHLHNLVPAAFLWEWTSSPAIRAATVVALGVVPLAILSGAFDGVVLGAQPGGGLGPGWASAAAAVAPPGSSVVGLTRFFVAFAYLQTVHYLIWCWVMPRHAGPPVRGNRLPMLLAAGTAVVGAMFLVDYTTGRVVYSSLASYHAYLELPVLLAFLSRRS